MSKNTCPAPGELVAEEIGRIATQYREAHKFIALMKSALGEVEQAVIETCRIPEYFDLDTAIGEQLTILGKALGWPRCHCICDATPVYGFRDFNSAATLEYIGPCDEGTWIDCNDVGAGQICIDDDETYRRMLKARRYQFLGLYDIASLQTAAVELWGKDASILDSGGGEVIISTGRDLTTFERRSLPLFFRVLPIAPGIRTRVDIGPGLVAGFGAGWGGACDGSRIACPIDPHIYDCA